MPSPIMRATTAVSTRSRLESAHLSRGRVSLYPSLFEVSCVLPAQVDLGCLKLPGLRFPNHRKLQLKLTILLGNAALFSTKGHL